MEKTIRLNDYDFNYVEKGSGQTILFVHGSASDYRTWSASLDAFAKEFHVILYSRRFHWPNERIKEDQDYSMEQHVKDLRSLIKYIGEEPVYLIGHSYGALMCLEIACNTPALVRKMVLAEPPAIRLFVSNVPKPAELLKLMLSRPQTALSIMKLGARGLAPATRAAKEGNMEKAMHLFGKAALGKRTFEAMTIERKEQALINLTPAEFTGTIFLPIDTNKLRKCNVPTLLLTGQLSPKLYGYLADRLEELMPMTKRQEISRSSHIMHEDNVEEFTSVVLSFLRE